MYYFEKKKNHTEPNLLNWSVCMVCVGVLPAEAVSHAEYTGAPWTESSAPG